MYILAEKKHFKQIGNKWNEHVECVSAMVAYNKKT